MNVISLNIDFYQGILEEWWETEIEVKLAHLVMAPKKTHYGAFTNRRTWKQSWKVREVGSMAYCRIKAAIGVSQNTKALKLKASRRKG